MSQLPQLKRPPDADAERKAQMNEKVRLTLRKPLAPKGDDAECKAVYGKLLKEYADLKERYVDGDDYVFGSDKAHAASLEEYNSLVGEYDAKRDRYNAGFVACIESIEDVRGNIEKLREQFEAASKASDDRNSPNAKRRRREIYSVKEYAIVDVL